MTRATPCGCIVGDSASVMTLTSTVMTYVFFKRVQNDDSVGSFEVLGQQKQCWLIMTLKTLYPRVLSCKIAVLLFFVLRVYRCERFGLSPDLCSRPDWCNVQLFFSFAFSFCV